MTEVSDSLPSPARWPQPSRFDAVLYPNRSLGSTGFALLMGAIVTVSILVGAGFAMVGAWPVTGFLGLDVLLLYLAFRWNFRDARRAEIICLNQDGLKVRRMMPDGESRDWHFETAWVQVIVENHQLKLRSHGKELVIGACLTADERSAFAEALRSALQAHREDVTG